jgi:hypothetical protein
LRKQLTVSASLFEADPFNSRLTPSAYAQQLAGKSVTLLADSKALCY